MAISANIFEKCLPAIGNNVNECGAVTLCDVITAESDELTSIFTDGAGKYRDLNALLAVQFEMKACGARQNGLYDFLMSNKRMLGQKRIVMPLGPGNSEITPFVLGGQHTVINAEYWSLVNLFVTGTTYTIHVRSRTSIPLDERWFVPGMNIYVHARSSAGTALRGAFLVTNSQTGTTFGGNSTIMITATAQNSTLGWVAKAAFTGFTGGAPLSAGVVIRGTANVQDVERWCYNRPALNDRKHVPFWFETDRNTMCTDEYYEAWFKRLQSGNDYFREFGDVDTAKRNKQLADINQREWINKFFWNKRISANQTLGTYRSLDQVSTVSNSTQGLYVPNEGRCVGYKANAIGVYEQLAECGQVFDLQNQRLNLVELFENLLYPIWRARGDQGIPNGTIEIFTDSFTASQIQRGMIEYYNTRSQGLARFNIDTQKVMMGQMGRLGFNYDTYRLQYPITDLRVVTHPYFDDFAAAMALESQSSAGRFLWILDFTSIYPGIITSNRKVHRTGDVEALAKVDRDYACVMENPTQEISLNSLTWTAIVECTATSAIVENFDPNLIPAGDYGQSPYTDFYEV